MVDADGMTTMTGPNAEHIQCWGDVIAPKFERFRDVLIRGFTGHSDAALAAHGPAPGDRVIDVGCGFGDTTLTLARRVGPRGYVLGVEPVASFLEAARVDAAAEGLAHCEFLVADAQTHAFTPGFDLVFARFGTMFFASPVAAMRNLGRATRAGGRLAMVVWRALDENLWTSMAKRIALSYLPPHQEGAPTCGPGPFSMADRDTVRAILDAAGWREAAWEPIDVPVRLGSLDRALDLQLSIGPAGEIVREAGDRGVAQRPRIEADLREALAAYVDADGEVVVPSASWCVTAAWPG